MSKDAITDDCSTLPLPGESTNTTVWDAAEVPEDLGAASADQLLHLTLTGDSGSDTVSSGLDSVLTDLEVLHEAVTHSADPWVSDSIHQIQARVRVIAELHRRRSVTSASPPCGLLRT